MENFLAMRVMFLFEIVFVPTVINNNIHITLQFIFLRMNRNTKYDFYLSNSIDLPTYFHSHKVR